MARSRRYYRRTTSQRTVGFLSAFLPYPLQRLAETQLGSSLLFIGIPALIVAGVLQLNWDGSTPYLSIDRHRASEIRHAAHDELDKIDIGPIQQIHRSAHELWDSTIGRYQGYGPSESYPQPNYPLQSNPSQSYSPQYYQPQGYQPQSYQSQSYQSPSDTSQSYQSQSFPMPSNGLWR